MKPMKLISFTGVDGQMPDSEIQSLLDLNTWYHETYGPNIPYIELALLYFPEKSGSPRNPDDKCREKIIDAVHGYNMSHPASMSIGLAAHLCGHAVFDVLLEGHRRKPVHDQSLLSALRSDLSMYDRVQLNINARSREFSDEQVHDIYDYLVANGIKIIVQLHSDSTGTIESWFEKNKGPNHANLVNILVDSSRGRGEAPATWLNYRDAVPAGPAKQVPVGGAGGINSENIVKTFLEMSQASEGSTLDWWMDMESGIRTDNRLDQSKIKVILEAVGHHSKQLVG